VQEVLARYSRHDELEQRYIDHQDGEEDRVQSPRGSSLSIIIEKKMPEIIVDGNQGAMSPSRLS